MALIDGISWFFAFVEFIFVFLQYCYGSKKKELTFSPKNINKHYFAFEFSAF